MKSRGWLIVMMMLVIGACADVFEYSPNQIFDDDTPMDLNAKNLEWLNENPTDDTITIAFVGDSQRFYDELEKFIDKANTIQSIDFVLLAGDITDFGLLEEFELIADLFEKLNKPYISIVGNHDVLANGEEIFQKVFGPLNFTFTYQKVKFIAHNTNSREYETGDVPDITWLREQFAKDDHVEKYIAVSHVPPFDGDFDKQLEMPYTQILRNNDLLVSLHGHIHQHKDGYFYSDGVRYITSHSFEDRNFVLLKIYDGQVIKQIISY